MMFNLTLSTLICVAWVLVLLWHSNFSCKALPIHLEHEIHARNHEKWSIDKKPFQSASSEASKHITQDQQAQFSNNNLYRRKSNTAKSMGKNDKSRIRSSHSSSKGTSKSNGRRRIIYDFRNRRPYVNDHLYHYNDAIVNRYVHRRPPQGIRRRPYDYDYNYSDEYDFVRRRRPDSSEERFQAQEEEEEQEEEQENRTEEEDAETTSIRTNTITTERTTQDMPDSDATLSTTATITTQGITETSITKHTTIDHVNPTDVYGYGPSNGNENISFTIAPIDNNLDGLYGAPLPFYETPFVGYFNNHYGPPLGNTNVSIIYGAPTQIGKEYIASSVDEIPFNWGSHHQQ